MFLTLKNSAIALATASALGFATLASAGYNMPVPAPMPGGNWYVGLVGGATFTPDITAIDILTGEFDFKNGYDAGARVGYRVGPFRFEGEYNYQHNKVQDVHNADGGLIANGGMISGRLNVQALMLNGFYDFNEVSDNFGVYLGAGIGAASLDLQASASGTPITNGDYVIVPTSAKKTNFAYQGMIGFNFNVDSNFVIDVGYRYFGAAKSKKIFADSYQTHMVNVGLTYHVPA